MEEQEYILEKQESFCMKHIFECGQCFRWNREEDESYTGVIKDAVLNVKQKENKIIFKGICKRDLKTVVRDYFDLDNNYENIKEKLSRNR